MLPKGSMTHDVFVKWIERFQQFRVGGKNNLLIFGGVKSHLDSNIVKAAEKYDITLFVCQATQLTSYTLWISLFSNLLNHFGMTMFIGF